VSKWPDYLDESRFNGSSGYDEVMLLSDAENRAMPWLMPKLLSRRRCADSLTRQSVVRRGRRFADGAEEGVLATHSAENLLRYGGVGTRRGAGE